MPPPADFTPIFAELRAILAEHEPKLAVVHDTPTHYSLDTFTTGTTTGRSSLVRSAS
jgi:hypothetical protein